MAYMWGEWAPLPKEGLLQLNPVDFEMPSDVGKDRRESPNTKRGMVRNSDVMLTAPLRSQSDVTAGLARDLIAETTERDSEVRSGQIPRQPWAHAANTSSRT